MSQQSKTALLTGASSGIGKELAKLLAQDGYDLVLMARRQSLLDPLKQEILEKFKERKILTVASDVSQFEKHSQDIKQAVLKLGRLDLVIANAGIGPVSNEWENTWEQTKQIFDTNVLGAIATIEFAKDFMLKQKSGHIVGISSIAGVRGLPQSSAYCASKAAFTTFLESMRTDLLDQNIKVTTIYPGFVETPLTENNGPMPFLLSVEKGAEKIFKAIKKQKSRFYFPWQMSFIYTLMRVMPDWLFDVLMKVAREKTKRFKEKRD